MFNSEMVGFFLKNTPNGNARNDGMFHHFVTQIEACTNENAMGYGVGAF